MLPGWSIPLVFVVGAISQYVGAAIGVFLFETTEPATVAWLRATAAAVALMAWRRPWRRRWTRRQVLAAAMFGLVTVAMNISIYEAIARIPLGTAVAIEFIGPTTVAALGSRRRRDFAAVALAASGVLLLAGVEFEANLTGVLFALLSAAMWAGYILLGKRVADTGDGLDSLAVGMALAAVVLAPAVLVPQARIDASVFAEPRTWLLGLCIGLLSTAIPYALDQVVLVGIGSAKFALLLALLPATATLIGLAVLRQVPTAPEVVGVSMVVAALVLSARESPESRAEARQSI
ncbi:permease [Mycolicibacterium agri]|uniref:Permease n=1 Tax=Mycolicibacterium agri TaxID=36811 RepID=A0A7I9W7F0_MYCAG|nr:EamA family transporter [Mycolicibacterium agri]GFG53612.1 permease [Mycolicibacterium agri]